jgi:hypothetical protein
LTGFSSEVQESSVTFDSLGERIAEISNQMNDFQNNIGKASKEISGQLKQHPKAKSALALGLSAIGNMLPKDIDKQIRNELLDGQLSDFSHHDAEPIKTESSTEKDSETANPQIGKVWDLFKSAFGGSSKTPGSDKDDGLVDNWDNAHGILDKLQKSQTENPNQTSDSMALKILSMLKPKNLMDLILAINTEITIWDLSNHYCIDTAKEIFDALKNVVLNKDQVEKKDVLLTFFDALLKYEREKGVVGTFNKAMDTCFKHDSKVLKLGVLKLLYFNEELRNGGIQSFQLMLTIPMVAVSLMKGDVVEAGKSIGRILKFASNTQLQNVSDADLENVSVISCGRGFVSDGVVRGKEMMLKATAGEGVGIGETPVRFGWVELYRLGMDALSKSKEDCIGNAKPEGQPLEDN